MVEINRDTHRQPHFQRHQRISASRLSVCVCVCGQPERPHANVGRVAGSQFWSDLQFFGPILGQQKSSELFAREREGSGSIWKLEKQKNCFWKLLAWSLIKKRGEQEKKFSNCTIFRKFSRSPWIFALLFECFQIHSLHYRGELQQQTVTKSPHIVYLFQFGFWLAWLNVRIGVHSALSVTDEAIENRPKLPAQVDAHGCACVLHSGR